MKTEIQKDYEAITNFKEDWIEPLMKKYNLIRDEVLDQITL